jgi:DNA-binding CsgD family transcriptional regulator
VDRATCEREWLDLVGDLLEAPLAELPAERIAAQLVASFRLRAVAYNHREPGGGPGQLVWPPGEQFRGHRAEVDHWGVCRAPVEHPILRYYLATRDWRAIQVADVPARYVDAALQARWREVTRAWGTPAHLALPLHVGPRSHRAFVLGRADRFTADEVRLARTIQHVLRGVDRRIVVVRTWFDPTARDVASAVHLTPRELAVLAALAEGLTAAAIGRRLLITERTVHKHLERLYTKLGVGDRLAAVLAAQRLGLLRAR